MALKYFNLKDIPQSKDAPFELYSEKIRFREFKSGRVDVHPIESFLFTDAQGYLRVRPIADVNDYITGIIKTLNGLTSEDQLLATTENGTNFTISSTGSTHSFNLPIASATNTGKLSTADWIRFDAAAAPVLGDLLSNSNAANIIGGTNAVIGGNVTIDFNAADAADDGILTSADWITFSSKIGSVSNALTATGTLAQLGGDLVKHTTINLGDPATVFTTKYRLNINVGNSDPLITFFQQAPNSSKIALFLDMSSGTLQGGVSNSKTNTEVDDQLIGGGPGAGVNTNQSFSWVTRSSGGYAGIFSNTSSSSTPHGILARITGGINATVANIFHAETETAGVYSSKFIVKSEGKIGIGQYTPETTAMITVVSTSTLGSFYLKNTTSTTAGGFIFDNQSDINTWRLGNYGASNSFGIAYGGTGRGIFMDISGAIGFGNPVTAYKCTIGAAGYANTPILQVINSISAKAYDVTSSGGVISQAWFGSAPQTQKTTASATSTFVANAGTAVNDASTFDGYTLKQVVKALREYGLLA